MKFEQAKFEIPAGENVSKIRICSLPIITKIHVLNGTRIVCGGSNCPSCLESKNKYKNYVARIFTPIIRFYFNILPEKPTFVTYENGFTTGYRIFSTGKRLGSLIYEMQFDYPSDYFDWCLIPFDKNPQRLSFLDSIRNNNDIADKLVYSDWLEENGEIYLAEAVRLMVEGKNQYRMNELRRQFYVNVLNPWAGIDINIRRTIPSHGFPIYNAFFDNPKKPGIPEQVKYDDLLSWEMFDLSFYKQPGNHSEIEKLVKNENSLVERT